jgi:hypothetical protein
MLLNIGAKMVRHGLYVTFQMAEGAVSGRIVRADPGPDRLAACAGLTQVTVNAGRNSLGDLCPDDEKHGHRNHETAAVAGFSIQQSAPPSRIELQIAVQSPNAYSYVQNWQLSGECQIVSGSRRILSHVVTSR